MASRKDNKENQHNYQLLNIDFVKYKTILTEKYKNRKGFEAKDPRVITAFIPGTIKKIFVSEGDKVQEGEKLLELEAMKMKNLVTSSVEGKVKTIFVKSEEVVPKEHILLELEYPND